MTISPQLAGHALPDGGPATVLEAFLALASRPGPWLSVGPILAPRSYSGAEVVGLARRWRRALLEAGVRRGDRVAILLPNDERFVGAFFGAQLAGAAPVPLPWPAATANARQGVAALLPRVAAADVAALVTDAALDGLFQVRTVTQPGVSSAGPDVDPDPSSAAFIQYTSGSLSRPRGAVISHRAAVACVRAMGSALGLSEADVAVSWLPLFHDMGLVGGLLNPVVYGFPLHLIAPGEFLLHPSRWLDRASAAGVTVAAAPDFAWRLATRRASAAVRDLSTWRVAIDGAEPVHRATLDAFAERFAPSGFPRAALRPAYGLAENTLATCIYDPSRPAADVEHGGRLLPSVGGPIAGNEVAVNHADGRPCAEGEEGEILLRSASRMDGYFRDDVATSAVFEGEWLRTGDLGVIRAGQMHVSGREKELVIQNGSKFHPYDIERVAADAVDAPLAAAAAYVVTTADGELLVLATELLAGRSDGAERKIRGAVLEALGVRIDRVMVVPPGALPRTSSGKIRRAEVAGIVEGQHGA